MDEIEPTTGAWPGWVQTWILPYVDDMALWPVLVAVLGHVLVVLVPLELVLARTAHPIAAFVLAALLAGTGEVVRMEVRATGRPRALTGIGVGMWLLSVPCAYGAHVSGIL